MKEMVREIANIIRPSQHDNFPESPEGLAQEIFDHFFARLDELTKGGCCTDADCAWCKAIDQIREEE